MASHRSRNWSLVQQLTDRMGFGEAQPFLSIVAADVFLLDLAIWDWKSHKRLNVFPVMLALSVIFHVSLYLIHDEPFWVAFFGWFSNLSAT